MSRRKTSVTGIRFGAHLALDGVLEVAQCQLDANAKMYFEFEETKLERTPTKGMQRCAASMQDRFVERDLPIGFCRLFQSANTRQRHDALPVGNLLLL